VAHNPLTVQDSDGAPRRGRQAAGAPKLSAAVAIGSITRIPAQSLLPGNARRALGVPSTNRTRSARSCSHAGAWEPEASASWALRDALARSSLAGPHSGPYGRDALGSAVRTGRRAAAAAAGIMIEPHRRAPGRRVRCADRPPRHHRRGRGHDRGPAAPRSSRGLRCPAGNRPGSARGDSGRSPQPGWPFLTPNAAPRHSGWPAGSGPRARRKPSPAPRSAGSQRRRCAERQCPAWENQLPPRITRHRPVGVSQAVPSSGAP